MANAEVRQACNTEYPINPPSTTANTRTPGPPLPQTSRDDTSLGTAPSMQTTPTTFSKFNYARRMAASDDQTVATTQPSISATNNSRFDEMEAEIQKHQAEFKTVLLRFDKVEDQALRTMAVCQASSRSLLELKTDSAKQLSELRHDSAMSMQQLRDETTANQQNLQAQLRMIQNMMTEFTRYNRSRPSSPTNSIELLEDSSATSSSSMSTSNTSDSASPPDSPMQIARRPPTPPSQSATSVSSSMKKKEKKTRSGTESKSTDQDSAHYKKPSAPDGMDQ